jgi:hypothetical protein
LAKPDLTKRFLDVVFSESVRWACYSIDKYDVYQTIDLKRGLLIVLTLNHPTRYRLSSKFLPNSRVDGEVFDQKQHEHWYELKVHDPLFRWGKKSVISIRVRPGHPRYDYLKRMHKKILRKTTIVPMDRSFESRESVLERALLDMIS